MTEKHDPTQYVKNGVITRGENDTGISIYDPQNPRSVYSLVPPEVRDAIENINPKLFSYSEKALKKGLDRNDMLEERDYRLRIAFWAEYNMVQDGFKPKMNIANVTRGICTRKHFYDVVIKTPQKLAWILYPVQDYQTSMEEMLDYSMREMRKVLTLPLHKKKQIPRRRKVKDPETGLVKEEQYFEEIEEVDIAAIREKIKIFALLDNRIKGAVTQTVRIDQRTQNLHRHQHETVDHTKNQEAPKSLEMIEKEIKQIERQQSGVKLQQEMQEPLNVNALETRRVDESD